MSSQKKCCCRAYQGAADHGRRRERCPGAGRGVGEARAVRRVERRPHRRQEEVLDDVSDAQDDAGRDDGAADQRADEGQRRLVQKRRQRRENCRRHPLRTRHQGLAQDPHFTKCFLPLYNLLMSPF